MPTYYVSDYDGERNDDAVEPVVLSPVDSEAAAEDSEESTVETKVVTPDNAAAAPESA